MRITSSGNVGIGTTRPGQNLTIDGASPPIAEIRSGGFLMLRPTGNTWDMRLQATGNQLDVLSGGSIGSPIMSLLHGGNVGIGTTGPAGPLDILTSADWGTPTLRVRSSAGHPNIQIGSTISGSEQWAIIGCAASGCGPANALRFYSITDGADRMVIDTNGNVGIGTTSPAYLLDLGGSDTGGGYTNYIRVAGTVRANGFQGHAGIGSTDFSGHAFNLYWTGATEQLWIDNTNIGNISVSSDKRVKHEIRTLPDTSGIEAIDRLNPVSFYWNDKVSGTDQQFGFIAQEVRQVFPNLVRNTGLRTPATPDGLLHLEYDGLFAPIVKAVQELKALFDVDHDALATLKADNDNLRHEFEAYKATRP
jgi:Chaperone of endosialidase